MTKIDTESLRTELVQLIQAEPTSSLLTKHLDATSLGRMEAARARLSSPELLVAVIGRQGVGKSSLINALLGRRIAPVDETETTNVVCFYRHATASEQRLIVTFDDGRREQLPLDELGLRELTDEQMNPENRRRVARADVYVDSRLLETGIVLVDTPGVGSLTPTTERVTMEFLPKIALGLFLVGTAPTLLDSEARFLRTTWKQAGSFIFVQNAWSGAEGDVEEARVDNLRKLEEISREEEGGAVRLVVVDVREALARLRGPSSADRSGLRDLQDEVRRHVIGGVELARVTAEGATFAGGVRAARDAVAARLVVLDRADAQNLGEFRDQLDQVEERATTIEREWLSARRGFEDAVEGTLATFDDAINDRLGEVRDAVVELARAREVPASKLGQVFTLRVEDVARRAQKGLERGLEKHVVAVTEAAEGLVDESLGLVSEKLGVGPTSVDAGGAETVEKVGLVVETIGTVGLNLAIATAGYAAVGAIIAGKGVLAALAAGAAAVPGVGWAVAAGVLVAGYGMKKVAETRAVAAIVAQLEGATRTAERSIRKQVREAVRDRRDAIMTTLGERLRAALAQQRGLVEQLRIDREASAAERGLLRARLHEDREQLALLEQRIDSILARATEASS